jgi:hypothetical protein
MLLNKNIYACVIVALLCALECQAGCEKKINASHVATRRNFKLPSWGVSVSPELPEPTQYSHCVYISSKIKKVDLGKESTLKEAYEIIINNNDSNGAIGRSSVCRVFAGRRLNDRHIYFHSEVLPVYFDEHLKYLEHFDRSRNAHIFQNMRSIYWALSEFPMTNNGSGYDMPGFYSRACVEACIFPGPLAKMMILEKKAYILALIDQVLSSR